MGYYSFYKILKDIIRTIIGNKKLKLLFTFLFIFFILFLFNKSKVCATDINYDNTYLVKSFNENITLPEAFKDNYWFCYISYNTKGARGLLLKIVYAEREFSANETEYGGYIIPSLQNIKLRDYQVSGGTWTLSDIQTYVDNLNFDLTSVTANSYTNFNVLPYTFNKGGILASNFDIKNSDGDIVIPKTNGVFISPRFDNSSDIENGYPDGVFISPGNSYSDTQTLYFHLLQITQTISDGNETIYYYSPKIFALNNTSKYYRTWENDVNNENFYYYVSRGGLSLEPNSSYLYVLTNSPDSFTNSYGILQEDLSNGIFDVVESSTTGVVTTQDSINDKIQNIDDNLNDDTLSDDTATDIGNSLNFNNQNESLNSLNTGFFSRLTSMLSNLMGYNLSEDTVIIIPLPHSEHTIELHSKMTYDYVTGGLRVIINAFWLYVFTFYMWKFLNKIYIAVSTGNILDTFSSSGEAITNNML